MQTGSCVLHAQVCPTLCDPMDCSPPGSSVHGIFQARISECVAISSSRGSSQPRDGTRAPCISCLGRQILYHCATWEARGRRHTPSKVLPSLECIIHFRLQMQTTVGALGGRGTLRIPASVFRPTFPWFQDACKSHTCSLICSPGHRQLPAS